MSNRQNQHINQWHLNRTDERSNNYLQYNQPHHYTNQNNSLQNFSLNNELFPGYVRNDNRPIPAGFYSTTFQATYSSLEHEQTIKKMSDEIKKLQRNQAKAIINFQEHQPESQMRIGVCDDSDEGNYDEYDAPVIPSVSSASLAYPLLHQNYKQKQKIKKHLKKCNKKRKKYLSTLSSSDTDSSISIDNDKKMHRHHSSKIKKKHQKRRHRSTSSSSLSEVKKSKDNFKRKMLQSINVGKLESLLDVRRNPWGLLTRNNINYSSTHIVIDPRKDEENLMFNKPKECQIPAHSSLNFVLTAKMDSFELNSISKKMHQDRYFSSLNSKNFQKGKVKEKHFRKINYTLQNYIPLSQFPCSYDDELLIKNDLTFEQLQNMTTDDYVSFKKSCMFSSYEEADLDGKKSILYSKCNLEPKNINAWIDFVRLQRDLMAYEESGNSAAPVKNTKALYERQQEILANALKKNPGSVELAMEKIKVIEAYPEVGNDFIADAWKKLEIHFVNSLEMWEENIKSKQNNRSIFNLSKLVDLIDKCLSNLSDLKDGVKKSHKPQNKTEEFLAKMIFHRCKLCYEAGVIDEVILTLQALTEYHFFAPLLDNEKNSSSHKLKEDFRSFWDLGIYRIGDEKALGWKNSDYTFATNEDEAEILRKDNEIIQNGENKLIDSLREKNLSCIEIWRQIDKFRAENYWSPVRNMSHSTELIEHTCRMIYYDKIGRTIFNFSNKNLVLELVFKILQMLGASISGMKETNQRDILQQLFSIQLSKSFPDFSLNLWKIDKFFDNYFDLLAQAEGIDVVRVYCSKLATSVKFLMRSSLTQKEQKKKMAKLMEEYFYLKLPNIQKVAIFYHQANLYELMGNEVNSMQQALTIIISMRQNIWKMHSLERSVYLEFIRWYCRRLPFSTEKVDKEASTAKKHPKTKFELLYWLGVNGVVEWAEKSPENDIIAKRCWKELINYNQTANKFNNMIYSWFCNENEALIELASLYFFESYKNGFKSFKVVLNSAPLAKFVGKTEAIYKLQILIYEYCMRISVATPKELKSLLIEAMNAYPHNVEFLKKYIELNRIFNVRYFLQTNMGNDELTIRIRHCALVYIEWYNYFNIMKNGNDLQKKQYFTVLSLALENAASELTNVAIPDSYLWCLLMHIEQENRSSVRRIDEVFTLAHKQCPWSKSLLYEAAWKRADADGFQSVLTNLISISGVRSYCTTDEVPFLLEDDVINEEKNEYDSDDNNGDTKKS